MLGQNPAFSWFERTTKKRIRILLETSQDMVYVRPDHCCYHSRVNRVEIHIETVTSFTHLLIEDVLSKERKYVIAFSPIYTFWGSQQRHFSALAHFVVDVNFRNGNHLFTNCCPGIINISDSLNGCRLKTSTPQSPKRAQRMCWPMGKTNVL